MSSSCAGLWENIRVCIQKSDCLQKDNHTFHACLKDKDIRPAECEEFIYGYYQCKHDQIDPRARFRGNRGY